MLTPALLHGTVLQAQELHGDPRAGHELAAELCSGCHLIDDRQGGPVADGVPTFAAIDAVSGPTRSSSGCSPKPIRPCPSHRSTPAAGRM
ncbi:MAG: hypothetical protein R3D25_07785 [Geminicoccaceae bacterium]